MKQLIEALQIFLSKYPDDIGWPTNCSHDELRIMCDPDRFTEKEIEHLEILGFNADKENGNFFSFKYGSC